MISCHYKSKAAFLYQLCDSIQLDFERESAADFAAPTIRDNSFLKVAVTSKFLLQKIREREMTRNY